MTTENIVNILKLNKYFCYSIINYFDKQKYNNILKHTF